MHRRFPPTFSAVVLALALVQATGVVAADAPPAQGKADAGKPSEAVAKPDPTAAVIGEGSHLYRQRDLDALVLIAQRHARTRFGAVEDERLRSALTRAFVAREAFNDALAGLPSSLAGAARDALVLDLLGYQAEPLRRADAPTSAAPAGAAPPVPTPAPTAPAGEASPPATASTPPAGAPAPAAPTAGGDGPSLVRLPPLTLSRTIDKLGKRTLTLGLALYFTDPALAKRLEDKAPLIQDAILGHVQQLTAGEFTEPNQIALKAGLTKAITVRVPEFPADGILIPQLDTEPPANP